MRLSHVHYIYMFYTCVTLKSYICIYLHIYMCDLFNKTQACILPRLSKWTFHIHKYAYIHGYIYIYIYVRGYVYSCKTVYVCVLR